MGYNTIHLEECGTSTPGCTEKLYMAIPDFAIVVNKKRYRAHIDADGNLAFSCINGLTQKQTVNNGHLDEVLSIDDDSYDPFDNNRYNYNYYKTRACNDGCKECPFATKMFDITTICSCTGDVINKDMPLKQLSTCPFRDRNLCSDLCMAKETITTIDGITFVKDNYYPVVWTFIDTVCVFADDDHYTRFGTDLFNSSFEMVPTM